MRIWLAPMATLSLLLVVGPAMALEFEGAGLGTCSDFNNAVKNHAYVEEQIYFSWAEGFISGGNVARRNDEPGAFTSMPAYKQEAHIREFCAENPSEPIFKAVFDLYRTLYPKVEKLEDK